MISIDEFRGVKNVQTMKLMGLSTDEKPIKTFNCHKIKNASLFYEMDTNDAFLYDEENNVWLPQQ